MNCNWEYLKTLGFEEWHIKWLQNENYLYVHGYTVAAMDNIHSLLSLGFEKHTILGLWVKYPQSFLADGEVFEGRVQELIHRFGMQQLEDFFWKHDELSAWACFKTGKAEWKECLKELREEFRTERKEKMQRLVKIGFAQELVDELEVICTEFQLEVLAEYYLENRYLRTLALMLAAGFQDILLQLFVDYPERFTLDVSVPTLKMRIKQAGNIWECYQKDGDRFLDALLDDEDEL